MRRFAALLVLAGLQIGGAGHLHAAITLPALVSDGMVLQRDREVHLWGWAAPGEVVRVHFRGVERSVSTDSAGQWSVLLPPMSAGGPYAMTIDGTNHIVLKDILVGEVWVCSGQSNMELPMARVAWKYADVIAGADLPMIRMYQVPRHLEFSTPQKDITPAGKWEAANPWSVLKFSATAFFFARALWEQYHVPVGLLNASVGGTPIQAWMSTEALTGFPQDLARAEMFSNSRYVDSLRRAAWMAGDAWTAALWKSDMGLHGATPWSDPAFDASSWKSMDLPAYFDEGGPGSIAGVVWVRRDFDVPSAMVGKSARLLMGRIVDADYCYINGVYVGSISYQYPPRRYDLAPGILHAGKNTIIARILCNGGRSGLIKDKPYAVTVGTDSIPLSGRWQYAVGGTYRPMAPSITIEYQPRGYYNGMLAPLHPYTIRGALWYQGESNAGFPMGYEEMLTSLITDWRAKWHQGDFPFLIVQLPNIEVPTMKPGESGNATLRDAQRRALALPNTGLAVTIDIGEWNDIHPLDKRDVGERLARAARVVAYGEQNLNASGPLFKGLRRDGARLILSFTEERGGLKTTDGGPLGGFEVAGSDGAFHIAQARIVGSDVEVWNDEVADPVSVRYAWADNPTHANLRNADMLPASPFEARR